MRSLLSNRLLSIARGEPICLRPPRIAYTAVLLHFEGRGKDAATPQRRTVVRYDRYADTQTDVLPGEPESAICVQRFDDSLNSAIHTTYRSWLRSSSMHEPRDPPLKVVSRFSFLHTVQSQAR